MPLHTSFTRTDQAARTHTWSLHLHDPEEKPLEALAMELAERIMRLRCGTAPLFSAWRARVAGGPVHPQATRAALEAFVQPAFGLPSSPGPPDHLEGFIAEHLWFALTTDAGGGDGVVMVTPPGFLATAPGGDGLVIHRNDGQPFNYRLWELKKCTGSSSVGSTVSTAYAQLDAKAAKYLAEYTSIGQEIDDPELAAFFGDLVPNWLLAAPCAAAGVAVHTSESKVPKRCFTTFGARFPRFTDPIRLRGMVTAVDDFVAFAKRVREIVWTGL